MLTHARRPSRVASCDARTTAVLCVDSTTTSRTFRTAPARHTDGLRLVLQIVLLLLLGIGTTCTELCSVLYTSIDNLLTIRRWRDCSYGARPRGTCPYQQ